MYYDDGIISNAIVYCLGRMGKVLEAAAPPEGKSRGSPSHRMGHFFRHEACNIVFLATVLIQAIRVRRRELVRTTTKDDQALNRVIDNMYRRVTSHFSLEEPILRYCRQQRSDGQAPTKAGRQEKRASGKGGKDRAAVCTYLLMIKWMEGPAVFGHDARVHSIAAERVRAVLVREPARATEEESLYLVTHFVFCCYNFGLYPPTPLQLQLLDKCGTSRVLAEWLEKLRMNDPPGLECWLETRICLVLMNAWGYCHRNDSPCEEIVAVVLEHWDSSRSSSYSWASSSSGTLSPFLALHAQCAPVPKWRYAQHVDYHTHFLVAYLLTLIESLPVSNDSPVVI